MLLDTGATMIALPAKEAVRMGINYKAGRPVQMNTANGLAAAYKVTLDTVKVGGLEVHQVEAVIQESGLDVGLLGMSFLKRTDMRNDGQQMVLTKRF
jgi:aspartyl protease family protein